MHTLLTIACVAGTFELVSNCDLEFGAIDVLEYETGPAGDAYEVEFREFMNHLLDTGDLNGRVFLREYLRHLNINIIMHKSDYLKRVDLSSFLSFSLLNSEESHEGLSF